MARPQAAPVKHPVVGALGRVVGGALCVVGTLTVFGGPNAFGIDFGSALWYWAAGIACFSVGAFVWSASTPDDGRRGSVSLFPPGGGGGGGC